MFIAMSAEVVKGSLKKAIANELDGEATFVVRLTHHLAKSCVPNIR